MRIKLVAQSFTVVSAATTIAMPVRAQGTDAAPIEARRTAAPRFILSGDTVLLDERLGIALAGLPPRGMVTVHLSGLEAATGWRSAARFRADTRGRLDLARSAPVSGDYTRVDPMGLFWSVSPDSTAAPPLAPSTQRTADARIPPPEPWELSADVGGRVIAVDTVWRRVIAPAVRVTAVRDRGLVGTLYVPPGTERHPAVVVVSGSTGGVTPASGTPGGLASRGYVVLALGYFAAEGLPQRLAEIPLEYFGTALRWLAEQPSVNPARIGVLGESRGGELALLLGATYPTLHAVVAYAPSHVVWPGSLNDSTRTPAWTLAGRAVPGMYGRETPEAVARHAGCPGGPACAAPSTLHRFLALLDDSAAAASAAIPVERTNGAVLLVSGRDDGIWPSTLMAERVVARLRRSGFQHPVEHVSYEHAGHPVGVGRPYVPTRYVVLARPHPITGRMITPGGTPEGNAWALEDAWRRVLAFLDANLRGGEPEPGRNR